MKIKGFAKAQPQVCLAVLNTPHFAKQKRQTLPVTVPRTAPVCYTRTLLKLIKEERKEADTQSVSASFLAPPVGLEPTTP